MVPEQGKVYCEGCRYLMPKQRPQPNFAESSSNPAVLEQWAKWDQKLTEIEQAEREAFRIGRKFTTKPLFYSWCKWWTESGRADWRLDHKGKPVIIYELAARKNAGHNCPHFKRGEPEPE